MEAVARKIWNDLAARKFAPVYVLQGEETYYIDRISNYIETHVLTEAEKSFNLVILYGKDSPVNVILTHAKRFPMMAERQVVIVREAQDIPDLQKDTGTRLMLDYLSRPVPSTILVLCHKHKLLDRRRELGKKVDELAVAANFKKPYDNQLPDFVAEYATEKNIKIDEAAIRVLCEYVGNDLSRLANEIDKVCIGLADGETVSVEKVMSQVGVSREYNIFELQKALIARDGFRLAKMVMYFEGNTRKNPVIPLVAFLYSFFSKLLVAATSEDRSERAMVTRLKISPFAAREYSSALQYYTADNVIAILSLLKETDLKLKGVNSGAESDGTLLKELLFRIILAG